MNRCPLQSAPGLSGRLPCAIPQDWIGLEVTGEGKLVDVLEVVRVGNGKANHPGLPLGCGAQGASIQTTAALRWFVSSLTSP